MMDVGQIVEIQTILAQYSQAKSDLGPVSRVLLNIAQDLLIECGGNKVIVMTTAAQPQPPLDPIHAQPATPDQAPPTPVQVRRVGEALPPPEEDPM